MIEVKFLSKWIRRWSEMHYSHLFFSIVSCWLTFAQENMTCIRSALSFPDHLLTSLWKDPDCKAGLAAKLFHHRHVQSAGFSHPKHICVSGSALQFLSSCSSSESLMKSNGSKYFHNFIKNIMISGCLHKVFLIGCRFSTISALTKSKFVKKFGISNVYIVSFMTKSL